jgi:acylpyruvate hydrolase
VRLSTVRTPYGTRVARVDGIGADAELVALPFEDIRELLESPDWRRSAQGAGPGLGKLQDADFAPLVPNPSKVLCVALNYRDHIESLGREMPKHPYVFAKFADCLSGANDDLLLPSIVTEMDWEAELGVVVGEQLRAATPEQARAAIAGYTLLNDISMRDWQAHSSQWTMGKIFDASTPIGPVLVTPDELPHTDGRVDIRITCEVDGVLRQDGRTTSLVFDVIDLLVYLSAVVTLRPGDIIATGTPGGVGQSLHPPVYLQPGQTVVVAGDGIGSCVNLCVGPANAPAARRPVTRSRSNAEPTLAGPVTPPGRSPL